MHSIGDLPSVALEHGMLVAGKGQSKNAAVRVIVTPTNTRTGSTGSGNSSSEEKVELFGRGSGDWLKKDK
jgi:hypothetical protein